MQWLGLRLLVRLPLGLEGRRLLLLLKLYLDEPLFVSWHLLVLDALVAGDTLFYGGQIVCLTIRLSVQAPYITQDQTVVQLPRIGGYARQVQVEHQLVFLRELLLQVLEELVLGVDSLFLLLQEHQLLVGSLRLQHAIRQPTVAVVADAVAVVV